MATTANNLAETYRHRGLEGADPLYQNALLIRERTLGPDHLLVAVSYNNWALYQRDRGDLTSALALMKRAAELLSNGAHEREAATARILTNLGDIYQRMKQPHQALPHYQCAQHILTQHFNPEHDWLIDARCGLAETYLDLAREEEASTVYSELSAVEARSEAVSRRIDRLQRRLR